MKTELVDVSETRRHLRVEIPTDKVDEEIGRVTARYGKSVRLPGFRPGRIPSKVVRQRFRGEILQDAAQHLVAHAVEDALNERGVQPVDTPDISDLKVAEGEPLTFTASFDVVPSFDPGDVTDIELRRPSAVVDDEEIEATLERVRQRAARFEPVDGGPLEAGLTAVVELSRQGTDKDGKKGEVDHHDQVSIEVGSPTNPPDFDDRIVGMQPGETRQFTVTYPNDYAEAELAGGTVDYTVTLKEVKKRVVPDLDDELAKDLGEYDSLAALRTRIREDLEAEARDGAEQEVRSALMKKLAERVPFPVPATLVDREADRRVQEFARRLMSQQVDPRQANIDWGAFREAQRESAVEALKGAMVLDELARRESIEVTDEDMEAELARYAEGTGRTAAAIRARLAQDGELPRLTAGLRRDKTMAWALGRARIVSI